MKLFGISLAAAALFALAPMASYAQHAHANGKADAHTAAGETHAHVAPHGGVVRSASPYHLELVAQPTELAFYLLGAKMSAVPNKGMSGSVLMQLSTNATMTVALTPAGDDHLTAKLPAGAKVRTAIVTLNTADGKALTVRFDKLDEAPVPSAVGAAFVCPMHSKVTASEPGKCPKCGMALVKKH
ncbi:heavy metal-binding domain-containing protein [Hymenobacter sp. UYCo722]|uniref:heavy metal-binding domain-containing protein n=1 Tax=Hymenobacter sp. UYCo722 TaxID=3156335 RepID=UPI0033943B0F